MIELSSVEALQEEIRRGVERDLVVLNRQRALVRPLRGQTRRIQPHSTTAVALVGTDGGNNAVQFDPFLVQLVRVVDSANNEYCLEAISTGTTVEEVDRRHFDGNGVGVTPLGRLMAALGLRSLYDLSFLARDRPLSPSWVGVYRELMEWAILLDLVRTRDFGTDTVLVQDGLLRSKVMRDFRGFSQLLNDAVATQFRRSRRRVYIAGVSKGSKVLQAMRLAMALEGIMRTAFPTYVEVSTEIQDEVIRWDEYTRGAGAEDGSMRLFNLGRMYFAKFGGSPYDPVWAVDILDSQAADAPTILGYLLADALDGFPMPFFPQCLQRAHDNAALVDFDQAILQREIVTSLRAALGVEQTVIDEQQLQVTDIAERRYS
jgi:hypothetical protein